MQTMSFCRSNQAQENAYAKEFPIVNFHLLPLPPARFLSSALQHYQLVDHLDLEHLIVLGYCNSRNGDKVMYGLIIKHETRG